MSPSGDAQDGGRGLAGPAGALAQYARRHPEFLRRSSFRSFEDENIMDGYTLQPWPVLLESSVVREMEATSVGLTRIFRAIPERLFEKNIARITEFYELDNEIVATMMLAPPNGIAEAPYRGDYVYTRDGLKCIEFNGGRGVGGWEASLYLDLYRDHPLLGRFLAEQALELECPNTTRLLFEYMIRQILRTPQFAGETSLNAAITIVEEDIGLYNRRSEAACRREFEAALAAVDPRLEGHFRFCRYSEFQGDGKFIYLDGRKLHAVFEMKIDDESTRLQPYRAFKAGRLNLYSGPATVVITDKRNLALLSEQQTSDRFTAEEQRLIATGIPWTRLLQPTTTTYRGEEVSLPDLVAQQKDELVLKRGISFGGHYVYIGCSTERARWDEAVANALDEGNWIIQERVESVSPELQYGEEGACPHDLIFGLFVFGEQFGGGFLRVYPSASQDVINVSRGAEVSPFLGVSRK